MAAFHARRPRLWFRHTGEREPGDDWSYSQTNRLGDRGDDWLARETRYLTDREIDEILQVQHTRLRTQHTRLQGQHTITHMIIRDWHISDHMMERATALMHLKIELLNNVLSQDVLSQRLRTWIGRLTNLQSLSLCEDFPIGRRRERFIPPVPIHRQAVWGGLLELRLNGFDLSELPPLEHLRQLKLSNCDLSEFTSREGICPSLAELELNVCSFSNGFPPLFLSLSQLRTLKIIKCTFGSLPERVDAWEGLSELELNGCCPDGLHPLFWSLSQLRTLKIINCKLENLPDRATEWESLTDLELQGCNFSEGLPPLFLSLSQLHTLKIYNCQLKELPDSLKQLVCLRKLDLSRNLFETLPYSVFCLPCIELIVLKGNSSLTSLGSSKLEMSKLQKLPSLVIESCGQLRQPPLQICLQGSDAIKSYYTDMGKDESCLLSLLTVGVLGESFSGKTSVVKSLKHRKRHLTNRTKSSRRDETTVVFNHETVDIQGGKTDIRFIDLGGNGVYHPTYRLTLKSNFIPALVVNIKRYMDLSTKCGHKEATRKLCFDWLAQFYLANHELGRPLLVLTHKDELSENQKQQKEMADHYRDSLLDTVAQLQRDVNMIVCGDHSDSIFEEVFVVGNDDSFDEFLRLLTCINNRSYKHLFEFPDSWKSIMNTIEAYEEPHLEVDYLKEIFSESTSLFVMLRFMQRSGRILWYEDSNDGMSSKIFHNIQRVTRTIAILFNHNSPDKWEQRKDEYLALYDEDSGERVGDTEFPSMITGYQQTGMMNEELLRHILYHESDISVEDALSLMKSFLLIYGPILQNEDMYYAVPYFASGYLNNQWMNEGDIRLRLSLYLDSPYALPQHVYHQMSLLLVSLDCMDCNKACSLDFKRNGATVYHDGWKTHFVHDYNKAKVTLQVSTNTQKLLQSWTIVRSSVRAILGFLSREWEAVRPRCILYCGSCLLTDRIQPDEYVDPSWCYETVSDECSGAEMVYCEEESCDVPACLVKPCSTMSVDSLESLRSYVHHKLYKTTTGGNTVAVTEDSVSLCTPAHPTQQGQTWETPRELDDLMKNTAGPDIILSPHQTPEDLLELYFNTDKVYPMSGGKRGRALIICNKYSSYLRRGAEQDFINMKRMFESFHFDVVGEHQDYTAQEIHDTIVRETDEQRHHRYGMFALVITSHGNDGLVYGNDRHSIRLCDIYGLLSATKFPAMKGKPKLVIIEACSGDKMDAPAELGGNKKKITSIQKPPITVCTDHDTAAAYRSSQQHGARSRDTGEAPGSGSPTPSHTEPNLSMDHLMIIKASTPGFGSMRHRRNGSWLIRAVVIAYYKHGHWRDLEELCKIAKEQVRLMGIARSREKNEALSQIPELTCYFTNERVVYLFPGYHG